MIYFTVPSYTAIYVAAMKVQKNDTSISYDRGKSNSCTDVIYVQGDTVAGSKQGHEHQEQQVSRKPSRSLLDDCSFDVRCLTTATLPCT